MIVNGIPISTYNANLAHRDISSCELERDILSPRHSESSKIINTRVMDKNLYIELEFSGSKEYILTQKSLLLRELLRDKVVIKFSAITSFEYVGHLIETSSIDNNLLFETVGYTFKVNQVSPRLIKTFPATIGTTQKQSTLNVVLESTKRTPAVIKITPTSNNEGISVVGFKDVIGRYNSMSVAETNALDQIQINGENSTFLINNTNEYTKLESWIFPVLEPGSNNITILCSGSDFSATIEYSPRFL